MDTPMPAAPAAALPQQQPRPQASQQFQHEAKLSSDEPNPFEHMLKQGSYYESQHMRWVRPR